MRRRLGLATAPTKVKRMAGNLGPSLMMYPSSTINPVIGKLVHMQIPSSTFGCQVAAHARSKKTPYCWAREASKASLAVCRTERLACTLASAAWLSKKSVSLSLSTPCWWLRRQGHGWTSLSTLASGFVSLSTPCWRLRRQRFRKYSLTFAYFFLAARPIQAPQMHRTRAGRAKTQTLRMRRTRAGRAKTQTLRALRMLRQTQWHSLHAYAVNNAGA